MRRDAPDPGADREGNLDLFVDGGFIAAGAQPAMIVIMTQRFQRAVGIEHAAAAGAEHVPGEVEQAEPGGMEKAGDHALFVEPGALGEIQHIDPVELVVLAISISCKIASATAGSAVCFSTENWAWMSLMPTPYMRLPKPACKA